MAVHDKTLHCLYVILFVTLSARVTPFPDIIIVSGVTKLTGMMKMASGPSQSFHRRTSPPPTHTHTSESFQEAQHLWQLLEKWTKGCLGCCLLFITANFPVISTSIRDQVVFSLFESRKPAFPSMSLTWEQGWAPALPPFSALSSFVPLPPCCSTAKKPLKLSFRWWQNSKAQNTGFEPEFSKSKAFLSLPAINA